MKNYDRHGVFKVTEKESHWSCGFGNCKNKADFIVLFQKDKSDGSMEEKRRGGCKSCTERWAEKDNCQSCLKRIRE